LLLCNDTFGHHLISYIYSVTLTSLPACWDTLRAGTNEGYFDFQHIVFFAHVESGYKSVLAIILGLLADTTCPFYLKITLLLPPPCKSYKQSSFRV
jgi:hypothetical protein